MATGLSGAAGPSVQSRVVGALQMPHERAPTLPPLVEVQFVLGILRSRSSAILRHAQVRVSDATATESS